jgi:cyclophilin family peptidyl-prolyl cis-trans isomerase
MMMMMMIVDNYWGLCGNGAISTAGASGKPLHFKNSPFHRIIPGFMAQVSFVVL